MESIEEYLQNVCPNDHQQFVRSLAILGNLRFSCEEFKSMYNKIYNWSFEMNTHCGLDGKQYCPLQLRYLQGTTKNEYHQTLAFPPGCSLIMEIKTKAANRRQYLLIADSKYQPGRLGLFSMRQISKGAVIGYYVGEVCKKYGTSDEGADMRSKKEKVTEDEQFAMTVRDNVGRVSVLRSMPLNRRSKSSITMGLHMAVDPGTETNDLRNVNTIFSEDGSLMAVKKIKKGQEILVSYSRLNPFIESQPSLNEKAVRTDSDSTVSENDSADGIKHVLC